MAKNTRSDWYEDGAAFAEEVQQALKDGKTFADMLAFEPGEAAHIRDLWKQQDDEEFTNWYDGYVSRWD